MKLLVCGGAGFIGSAFIKNHLKHYAQDEIINLDNLSIGSNLDNLREIESNPNYHFVQADIKNYELINKFVKSADIVVNFAAETHVDRSIGNSKPFIETNVLGTHSILEAVRLNDKTFVHVSTDEVYGDAKNKESFTENDMLNPSNPYSATKAAADNLTLAYHRTYGTKCIVTRCTNNFGPNQFPEKLIPKAIIRAQKDLKIPLYGDGNQIRSWIYVLDHVTAIEAVISRGRPGEIYNIAAWNEITNRSIVEKILDIMNKSHNLIEFVEDRPGHDRRYSIDASKIRKETGWSPEYQFDHALNETVKWYVQNTEWWGPLANEKTLHPKPWTLG
jgi:dTDP-glucose 4,6-dehydratase